MIDAYGREITDLRLSVTELCNLRCRYCMPEEGVCKKTHSEMLTEEEMVWAVEAAASLGVRKVRITGGEPLLKKNFLSICERVSRVSGIKEVCVTTNGILLTECAQKLKDAGVKRVNISLDTLDEKKYAHITRLGNLSQALNGLNAALEAGFEKIKINTVLIGGFNDDEILPLAQLTLRYPVDVRFIELMPIQSSDEFGEGSFVPCTQVLERLPDAVPVEKNGGVAQLYRLPGAQGNIGLINTLSRPFCEECNRLRLTADGNIKPCLHHPDEYPLKGLNREEMRDVFQRAIAGKPIQRGELSYKNPSCAGRTMNQIGG